MKTTKLFLVLVVLTGLVYPLLITLIGQTLFSSQSNGSLFVNNGKIVGSSLIGQKFDQNKYFWGRPSAVDYNTLPSGGSNYSATSKTLQDQGALRIITILASDPAKTANKIPSDLLYASGSGLDPHISPDAARFQVDRIALARHFDSGKKDGIIKLIDKLTEERDLNLFGEKRINVLRLNAELDDLSK